MSKYRCSLTFRFDDGHTEQVDEVVDASDEAEAKSKAENRHLLSDQKEHSTKPVATLQCHMTMCESVD